MVEEAKMGPPLRFQGFSDAWEQRKLGELIENQTILLQSDGNHGELYPKSTEFSETGIPYLSAANIDLNTSTIDFTSSKYLPINKAKIFKKGIAKDGDILLAHNATVGPTVMLSTHYPFVVLSTTLTLFRINQSKMNPIFFLYTLRSVQFQQALKKMMKQTTRNQVPILTQRNIDVSYPNNIDEQANLGIFFKQLDGTIALHQRKLTLLKQLKQTYLQALFPQSEMNIPTLRFAGFYDPWEQRNVSSLAKETYGGGTPRTGVKKYWKGSSPWIQSSDLSINQLHNVQPTKFITEEAIKQSATHNVPDNSIAIVTRVGVGKLALMPYSYSTSQDFLSLSNLNIDVVFGVYCLYKMLQREVNNIQGTSIKGITKADLLEKYVRIPTKVEEQVKIGALFKKIDDTIDFHERKLKQILKLKKAFLEKMFL